LQASSTAIKNILEIQQQRKEISESSLQQSER